MCQPEDIEGPSDIDIICQNRVLDTFWHAPPCCLMRNMGDSFFLEDGIYGIYIANIFFIKSEIWISFVDTDIFIMTSVKIIQTNNALPIFEKLFNDIASNKARASCNQYDHREN